MVVVASPEPRSRSPSIDSPNGGAGGGGDPSCRVSVAVRIRPLLGQELVDGSTECIVADAYDRKQVRLVARAVCRCPSLQIGPSRHLVDSTT